MRAAASAGVLPGRLRVAFAVTLIAAGCTQAEPDKAESQRTSQQPPAAAAPQLAVQPLLDEAIELVRGYWRTRTAAFSSKQEGELTVWEQGAAATLTREVLDEARLNGKPTPQTSTPDTIRVYMPRPSGFPRAFLAAVTATDPDVAPEVYLLVFTKRDARSSWKLSWWVRYADNTPLPPIVVDRGGFATQLTAPRQRATLLADTVTVERRLRDYLMQAEKASRPPRSSFFADAVNTYGTVKKHQTARVLTRLNGVVTTRAPRDARLPGFAFLTRDGALLAVTVAEDVVQEYIVEPLVQDPNRLQADGRIPPGVYRTIITRFLATYAVQIPNAGSGRRAVALASRWAVAGMTAKP
jgi:hypothetical protein